MMSNALPPASRSSVRRRVPTLAGALAIFVAALSAPAPAQQAGGAACDRNCLEKLLDGYLAAMARNAVDAVPRSATARYTENGQEMPLGEGIWRTASGLGTYRVTAADPQTGQIGFMGVVMENGTPAILGLRLKQVGGKVTEAEAVVGRSKEGAEKLEALGKPAAAFLSPVPAARRMSRAELIRTADLYFQGFGRGPGESPPFTPDCERIENGTRTTNNAELAAQSKRPFTYVQLGCEEQFKTGYLKIVTQARERRYPIVDEERQLVYGFGFLDHAGNVKSVKVADGREVPINLLAPFTWEFAELFRVEGGKLRQIEAVLNAAPYRMKSGWGDVYAK
jgi:hypothetical protein